MILSRCPKDMELRRTFWNLGTANAKAPKQEFTQFGYRPAGKLKMGNMNRELGRKEWEMERGSPGPLEITVRIGVLFRTGVHSFEWL